MGCAPGSGRESSPRSQRQQSPVSKRHSFLDFSYVCPEPVLVKMMIFGSIKWHQKSVFRTEPRAFVTAGCFMLSKRYLLRTIQIENTATTQLESQRYAMSVVYSPEQVLPWERHAILQCHPKLQRRVRHASDIGARRCDV